MKKKCILLIAVLICLGIAGCASKVSESEPTPVPTSTPTPTPDPQMEKAKEIAGMAIEELKSILKNPRSIEIYDKISVMSEEYVEISFSATNDYGGRMEDKFCAKVNYDEKKVMYYLENSKETFQSVTVKARVEELMKEAENDPRWYYFEPQEFGY